MQTVSPSVVGANRQLHDSVSGHHRSSSRGDKPIHVLIVIMSSWQKDDDAARLFPLLASDPQDIHTRLGLGFTKDKGQRRPCCLPIRTNHVSIAPHHSLSRRQPRALATTHFSTNLVILNFSLLPFPTTTSTQPELDVSVSAQLAVKSIDSLVHYTN